MTDPKGNGEFCFPETLIVSRGEAKGNIEGLGGNKAHCFPWCNNNKHLKVLIVISYIYWLVLGQMTSNHETVSYQMP